MTKPIEQPWWRLRIILHTIIGYPAYRKRIWRIPPICLLTGHRWSPCTSEIPKHPEAIGFMCRRCFGLSQPPKGWKYRGGSLVGFADECDDLPPLIQDVTGESLDSTGGKNLRR